jgi:hypothetical protein
MFLRNVGYIPGSSMSASCCVYLYFITRHNTTILKISFASLVYFATCFGSQSHPLAIYIDNNFSNYSTAFNVNIYSPTLFVTIRLYDSVYHHLPITVAARSKAWTVFARSNAGIVGSNPTRGMDVCVYSVFVLGSGLATGWSLVQGVLPSVLD